MIPRKNGEPWTKSDENTLRQRARQEEATKDIAKELERTPAAIRSKASEMDVSLKPKD
jgi:hypothetical protein